jgi:hypothetical protein
VRVRQVSRRGRAGGRGQGAGARRSGGWGRAQGGRRTMGTDMSSEAPLPRQSTGRPSCGAAGRRGRVSARAQARTAAPRPSRRPLDRCNAAAASPGGGGRHTAGKPQLASWPAGQLAGRPSIHPAGAHLAHDLPERVAHAGVGGAAGRAAAGARAGRLPHALRRAVRDAPAPVVPAVGGVIGGTAARVHAGVVQRQPVCCGLCRVERAAEAAADPVHARPQTRRRGQPRTRQRSARAAAPAAAAAPAGCSERRRRGGGLTRRGSGASPPCRSRPRPPAPACASARRRVGFGSAAVMCGARARAGRSRCGAAAAAAAAGRCLERTLTTSNGLTTSAATSEAPAAAMNRSVSCSGGASWLRSAAAGCADAMEAGLSAPRREARAAFAKVPSPSYASVRAICAARPPHRRGRAVGVELKLRARSGAAARSGQSSGESCSSGCSVRKPLRGGAAPCARVAGKAALVFSARAAYVAGSSASERMLLRGRGQAGSAWPRASDLLHALAHWNALPGTAPSLARPARLERLPGSSSSSNGLGWRGWRGVGASLAALPATLWGLCPPLGQFAAAAGYRSEACTAVASRAPSYIAVRQLRRVGSSSRFFWIGGQRCRSIKLPAAGE